MPLEQVAFFFFTFCDAPQVWQINVQDPATPAMEGMLFFHNYLIFFLILIGTFVFYILGKVLFDYNSTRHENSIKFTHSSLLEIIWTIIPAVVLIIIAIPSFSLLYSSEELTNPAITLKVIGHQWYWSYEYSDFISQGVNRNSISFDSYMIETNDLTKGSFRLLEVDHRIVLPIETQIRVLVTASDVLHSWAVPSFGFKIDACPGRLSQGSLFIKREGTFYGQCSEICGVNHGFMPIVVKTVSLNSFLNWANYKSLE